MATEKRKPTTVYIEPRLAKAVKVKAALADTSVSDIVNEALAARLRQDEADLRLLRERGREPSRPYEAFLKELKKDGLI